MNTFVAAGALLALVGAIYGSVLALDARYEAKTEAAQGFSAVQGTLVDIRVGQLLTRKEIFRREQWELQNLGPRATQRDRQRLRQLEDAIKQVDLELERVRRQGKPQ